MFPSSSSSTSTTIPPSGNRDRAAVMAPTVMHLTLLSSLSMAERRLRVEELLRDEFADIEIQAAADRGLRDA